MKHNILICLCLLLVSNAYAQGSLSFDETVKDLGQILCSDGAVSCNFVGVNKTKTAVAIQSVTTSCGCTVARWDHNPIAPGASTSIKVEYSNDEGPLSFDKTLTVKFVGNAKPVILHIRGRVEKERKSDAEIFVHSFGGGFAMSETSFKLPNIQMGEAKGDQITVANLSKTPVKVTFSDISDGLSLELRPNPVPASSHAVLFYSVTARQGKWGRNTYSAKANGGLIEVTAMTTENFSALSAAQKAQGSRPVFAESTFSFGHKKQGDVVEACFTCENKGKSSLHVYKIDSDSRGVTPYEFKDLATGGTSKLRVRLDTKNLPKGEALVLVTLTTNSPLRPVVTLFLAGWID